jgi:purine-binding chemotaxis protein CheW
VVDLRLVFAMSQTERTVNTCIIVVEVELAGETLVVGALADSVEEVIDLEPEHIQAAPAIGASFNADFIEGMGKRENGFLMILDIDKVFSTQDLAALKQSDNPARRGSTGDGSDAMVL